MATPIPVGPIQPPTTTISGQAEIERLTLENLRKSNALLEKQTAALQLIEDQAAEQKEIKRKARLAGANAQEMQRKKIEESQARCAHTKPNGTTQFVIQKLPGGKQAALCQICLETLVGDEVATLPMHLRPNPNNIGGCHY